MLPKDEIKRSIDFCSNSGTYLIHVPILIIAIGTYLWCGEIIGLTWSDIDMKNKQVSITHQLIYRNLVEGSRLCVTTPKTEAGIRDIPMTASVRKAFEKQREYRFAAHSIIYLSSSKSVAFDEFGVVNGVVD